MRVTRARYYRPARRLADGGAAAPAAPAAADTTPEATPAPAAAPAGEPVAGIPTPTPSVEDYAAAIAARDQATAALAAIKTQQEENAAALAAAQASLLRAQIAHREGLPAPLVEYVRGDTAEAIVESVKTLLGHLQAPAAPADTPRAPAPDPTQGGRTPLGLGTTELEKTLRLAVGAK